METPLFRGVRCSDHKLVYGNYVKSDKSWSGKQYHRDWIVGNAQTNGGWFAIMGKWAVVDGTVGQFTGRKDKNGIPVYERDIIMSLPDKKQYFVHYNEDKACFYVRNYDDEFAFHHIDKFVVVGNAWEDENVIKKLEKKNAEERRIWRKLK